MSTKRDHHTSLIEQRNTLLARRDALKNASAAALVDGHGLDTVATAEITDINHQLEALEAAIATVGNQADSEEEAARAESAARRLKQQGEVILADRQDFVGLMGALEAQARILVDTLVKIDQLGGKLDDACHEVTRDKTPTQAGQMSPQRHASVFRPAEVAARISSRIGSLLQTYLTKGGQTYGSINWRLDDPANPNEVWPATEDELAARGLIHVMRRIDEQIAALRAVSGPEE